MAVKSVQTALIMTVSRREHHETVNKFSLCLAGKAWIMGIDFAVLRQKMVDNQIRTVDVTQLSVLSAFLKVAREEFVPQQVRELAYSDEHLMIAPAQKTAPARYIAPPAALARLVQLADISEDDFVLDIGAGTGYCAAILSHIAGSVIALESNTELAPMAAGAFAATDCDNVAVVTGKLAEGYAAQAPYDVILIEGAVDYVPDSLFEQLREGGRLVAVKGHGNAGSACLYVREDNAISERQSFNLALKPLAGFLKKAEFTF